VILEVPAPDSEPWPSLGPQVCRWIEEHMVFGPGDLLGEPAVLDDEKRYLIWRVYEIYPPGHEQAGRRRFKRAGISLRKGSAKTELMAWIAGVELARDGPVRCDGFRKDGTPIARPVRNPYIPMCAKTEEQVELLGYGALREILMRSKSLEGQFDIGLDRIIRIGKGGREDGKAEAVASAPGARDGARTTFQCFDETHYFTTSSLKKAHQTMLQNIPKRRLSDAWSLETTTAYMPGERSVAESTHAYATAVEQGRLKDSRLFFFHRQASDGHDLGNREERRKAVVEASGPVAVWSSIDEVTDGYDVPDTDRTYWERVWLNRPVKAGDRAFDFLQWKAREKPGAAIPDRALVTLGFDGARHHDSTALVATDILTGLQVVAGLWERPLELRPDEDWDVPELEVTAAVQAAFTRWDVWRMYADPPYWETTIALWAQEYGEERVALWHTVRTRKMADAVRAFDNAVKDGHLSHDGDARYARHIGNAHKRSINLVDEKGVPLWTIYKERSDSPNKIDLAMAGILSWEARRDALTSGVGRDPDNVYNERAKAGGEVVRCV
jgi:phage terminase large subunit-like protein